MSLKDRIFRREDPRTYQQKDSQLARVLRTRDFIALGVGTVVGTAIFTLPGIVASQHAGPAVAVSFLLAAVVAGLVSFAYAEMASVMPFAGSAYSWIKVLFGEVWGWIAGWALLAEYFIAVAFVAAGLSANARGLFSPLGAALPAALSNPVGTNGGVVDLVAVVAIVVVGLLLARGNRKTTRVQNVLVAIKVLAVLLFVVVGATAVDPANYVPFIPEHSPGTDFGGWQGIYAGVSMIFLAYIGFDAIAANSAEAANPRKTMPRGIIGSLVVGVVLFVAVSLVLVGMFHYSVYADNAEPVGWALRQSGHAIVATVVQSIVVVGMFTALIGMMLAGSRLLYSFGRDGLLPRRLGALNNDHLPNAALLTLTVIAIVIGALFPFAFLSQLIAAGTLIAFMFVSLGIYAVRRRHHTDLPNTGFRSPGYPVLPALGFVGSVVVFCGLDTVAQLAALGWFLVGLAVYFTYGVRRSQPVYQDSHTSDPPKAL